MKSLFIVAACIIATAFSVKPALPVGESFSLPWPAADNWKIADEQDDATTHVILLVHAGETAVVWTELANMTTQKGITGVPVESAMQQIVEQQKKELSKPLLTVIEKDASAEYPWILFSMESQRYKKSGTPESQLWYVVQGKKNLYSNFIAIKTAAFSNNDKERWATFFKSGRVSNGN